MATKKNKTTTLKKSDIDFYKMSGVFAIACVFIMLTLKMSSTITQYRNTGANVTYNIYNFLQHRAVWVVGAIVVVASVVWAIYSKAKKVDERLRLFSSVNAVSLVAYLAVFALCFGTVENSDKHSFFMVFTIVVTVLYYISKSYHLDFIFYSTFNALLALLIYFLAYKVSTLFIAIKAVIVVALVIFAIAFRKKYANTHRKNKKYDYLFAPVFVSLAFFAVFMFVRAFARLYSPHMISSATMLTVMMIQYIVFGIVYTIKLIRQ